MTRKFDFVRTRGAMIPLSFCILLVAGCSKPEETTASSSSSPMKGSGGSGGRKGGEPVSANASGVEIYGAKCGCHGAGGKGGRAPVLVGTSRSEEDIYGIVHNGKGKMPALASQLTEEQIKKVATAVKGFK